jgi:hypothetical protein
MNLAACGKLPNYRYKLSVVVQTPAGPRTGFAVREVDAKREPHFLPEMASAQIDLRGEAVIVDLPNGKSLFALLNAPSVEGGPTQIALDAFRSRFKRRNESYTEMAAFLAHNRVRAVLPPSAYPYFVTFRDLASPRSAMPVDPGTPSTVLGDDFRIESVTIETTNAPITSTIEKRLPWLAGLATTLGGTPFKNGDSEANKLARGDFIEP